jgi:hypothetical protein
MFMRTRLIYIGLVVAMITAQIGWAGAIVLGIGWLLGFEG